MEWMDQAACLTEDPELFFPPTEVGPGAAQVTEAKAVCARCPVRSDCLLMALATGLTEGVFGGLSATERRALRMADA
jgi:WhiB family redox-sensing transcriptional regulator